MPPRQGPPDDPALVALGKKIFFDGRLSEPPGTSCASCHDPAQAFSGTHGSRLGVPLGSRPGHFARRSTPSVLYLRYTPAFYFFEDDENPAPEPRGGFFWDGRADTIAALVRQPLFNPDEMNAGSPARVARKIARAPYAGAFRQAFGSSLNAEAVLRGVGAALEAFLKSDEMTPASSKYDAYVRGQATLTDAERRGLEVFKDRRRGACAGCHRMAETSSNPADSMFTDYGYDAVALPRNRALAANEKGGARYDLGLCERQTPHTTTTDQAGTPRGSLEPRATTPPGDAQLSPRDPRFCSSFRTPSLRNAAVRQSFGHNGVYKSLREVLAFYANRAVAPARVYPPGQTFDDVPARFRNNVNVYSPVYNHREGAAPPLSDQDIDDLIAFLGTLTDAPFLPRATQLAGSAVAQSPPAARSAP